MQTFDWIVLISTMVAIVAYGTYKTRKNTGLDSYLKGDNEMRWGTIGLSIMATQASAITFLSTPGMAFDSGMQFLQFYIGLPIAMVLLSAFVLPNYYRLKVYTAYEFLESRFDLKTRMFTAMLFLVQRGLSAGITIYAPAIILSSMLGWDLNTTCLMVGLLVILYTVSGGTRAVSLTQKWQMGVIMLGLTVAFVILIFKLPEGVGFMGAVETAGHMGKLEIINFNLDLDNRYTIWSGIFGGVFLFMSYFGTDQSQVQRYLGGKSLTESRMGLMFNGLLKIPMQFFILFIGVMVFVFFQYFRPPVFFNQALKTQIEQSEHRDLFAKIEGDYNGVWDEKEALLREWNETKNTETWEKVAQLESASKEIRETYKNNIAIHFPDKERKDSDYIFLTWVLNYLPVGMVGLLMAVILSAAMSSTSGELNALASTTVVDFYKRTMRQDASEKHYLIASRLFTVFWGFMALLFALYASLFENLIEAVNILGSLFYGTVLGIFLMAFFIRYVKSEAVFIAAILSQTAVLGFFFSYEKSIGFLWYNFIGCALVVALGISLQFILPKFLTDKME
jgi:solute:Na+ symporter, SSS family